MAPRGEEPSLFDDQDGPVLRPPEEGFELYRYKDADEMTTKGWHGYYWPDVRWRATMRSVACPPRSVSTRCPEASCPRRDSSSTTRRCDACRGQGGHPSRDLPSPPPMIAAA
jgi:hypothetical protein